MQSPHFSKCLLVHFWDVIPFWDLILKIWVLGANYHIPMKTFTNEQWSSYQRLRLGSVACLISNPMSFNPWPVSATWPILPNVVPKVSNRFLFEKLKAWLWLLCPKDASKAFPWIRWKLNAHHKEQHWNHKNKFRVWGWTGV